MKRVILLNPNTDPAVTADMVAIAGAAAPPGIVIEGATVTSGARLIVDEATLAAAAVAVAHHLASLPSADGLIVAAYGDPGVDIARARFPATVVGIGEASMLEASANGRRFSVVTTTPALVCAIAARAEALGLCREFAGVQLTEGDPTELTYRPSELILRLELAVGRAIAEDRAEAVIIGGGPLAAAARELAPRFDVPIVEPIPTAVKRLARQLA
jgi:Asp/Glu/hydantoin racemase